MKVSEIIKFKPEHLALVKARENVNTEMANQCLEQIAHKGSAFTAVSCGQILGCAGVAVLGPGVGGAWAVFGDDLCQCRLWFHRTVRGKLRSIMDELKLRKVITMILSDSVRNIRWIESLGFRRKDPVPGPYNKDYFWYEIARGENV